MPRTLSPTALASAYASQTGEVWLLLLEITHASLDEPILLVNNTEDIISNGNTYQAFPFTIQLANDDAEHLPEVKLEIDNVEGLLVALVRGQATPPTFVIKVVLASQPDVVEYTVYGLTLREIEWTADTITGTLYADDLLSTRFPDDLITVAGGYYGLFRG